MNIETVQITDRLRRLNDLEHVIAPGLQTFIEVGEALAEVRDDELWRDAGYTAWEDYLTTRWNFGASRARQIIGGAKITRHIESVTGVTLMNESQARQVKSVLRRYPEEIQTLALEAVSKHPGGITADRLEANCVTLMEYATTGYVTAENGEQLAIHNAVKANRTEQGIARNEMKKLLDSSATIARVYDQDDGSYIVVKIGRGENTSIGSGQHVRLVIMEQG